MTPRPLALSPSRAADFQQCPLRYRLRAIDRIPEPHTIHQVKGTLVHAVLEEMHAWPREERSYPAAVKRLVPNWEKMLADDAELADLVPESERMEFLVDCRGLLKGYFIMEDPTRFDADAMEKFIGGVVGEELGQKVPVRGFIDRADVAPTGEIRIVDYKTGKKPHPRFQDSALFQMRFYSLVWWRLTGKMPTQARLMYLKACDDLVYTPTAADLESFEAEISAIWRQIETAGELGEFATKKGKLCDWCFFQSMCPEFGGQPPEYPGWPGSAYDEA